MRRNEVTRRIIGASYEVHRELGPGLLESAYAPCMALELRRAKLDFLREHPLPLTYNGLKVSCGYRVDFLVENCVVVELKSAAAFKPIFTAQMLTYLKLSGCQIGLLLNFNVANMQRGIKRVVLGFADE